MSRAKAQHHASGKRPVRKIRRRGMSMLYICIYMFVGLAFASLAVDWGRVELAKTQLKAAADAAGRAAVTQLGTSITAVQNTAITYAGYNSCDGSQVTITSSNIDFLDWDPTTKTYQVLSGNNRNYADALRITCSRTGANGIPLTFAKFAGYSTKDVNATVIIAMCPPGYGLVGLNYISLKGNSSTSYWSGSGSVGGNSGNIASNGNITSTGNSTIAGTVWVPASATITGISANARRTLTTPLSYANGSSGSYTASVNDNALPPLGVISTGNWNIASNKTYSIPAGHYYVKNFTVNSNGVMNCQGPVTVYVYGSFNLNGQVNTASSLPSNMSIVMIPDPGNGSPPGSMSISSGAALYANIYAPQSDITMSGSGDIYGQVVGKSITMTGSSGIYYDLNGAGGNPVQVVQ